MMGKSWSPGSLPYKISTFGRIIVVKAKKMYNYTNSVVTNLITNFTFYPWKFFIPYGILKQTIDVSDFHLTELPLPVETLG
jgi:hypothetical protein